MSSVVDPPDNNENEMPGSDSSESVASISMETYDSHGSVEHWQHVIRASRETEHVRPQPSNYDEYDSHGSSQPRSVRFGQTSLEHDESMDSDESHRRAMRTRAERRMLPHFAQLHNPAAQRAENENIRAFRIKAVARWIMYIYVIIKLYKDIRDIFSGG